MIYIYIYIYIYIGASVVFAESAAAFGAAVDTNGPLRAEVVQAIESKDYSTLYCNIFYYMLHYRLYYL